MVTDYKPKPIPTGHIVLSDEILALVELLAENAHDIWASERLRDGWTFGPERDDAERQHPCLVPYAQLPERERDYDRTMVMGSIRAMLALGFTISHTRTDIEPPHGGKQAADASGAEGTIPDLAQRSAKLAVVC
jgi:hypothetical protein